MSAVPPELLSYSLFLCHIISCIRSSHVRYSKQVYQHILSTVSRWFINTSELSFTDCLETLLSNAQLTAHLLIVSYI